MEKLINDERNYKHFLRYDQVCEFDIEYGFTDLYYDLNDSTLFIKKFDHRNYSEKELDFPVQEITASIETVLADFLINLMSYRGNFSGYPIYVESEIFTAESFASMLNESIGLMKERDELAILADTDNELINYCKSQKLNPEPAGNGPNNWRANCPSGGQHQIVISTKSNQWGCGYCRRKGDLNSLKEWHENKHDKA